MYCPAGLTSPNSGKVDGLASEPTVARDVKGRPSDSTPETSSLVPAKIADYLQTHEKFYDTVPVDSTWAGRRYRKLLAHYYRFLIRPMPVSSKSAGEAASSGSGSV